MDELFRINAVQSSAEHAAAHVREDDGAASGADRLHDTAKIGLEPPHVQRAHKLRFMAAAAAAAAGGEAFCPGERGGEE